jgi:hypothetical protein
MRSTPTSASESDDSKPRNAERLDSWKEIASFFWREVRTVQLWEKSEGLPVRRQYHKKLGSVYAYRHELDAWWSARSAIGSGRPRDAHGPPAAGKALQAPAEHGSSGLRILALPFEVIVPALDIESKRKLVGRFACGLQNDLVLELTRSKFHPVVLPLNSISSGALGFGMGQ